jgi:hypothetical protein
MDREILINYIQMDKGLNNKFIISAHTMNLKPAAEPNTYAMIHVLLPQKIGLNIIPLQPVISVFSKNCYILTCMHY